MTIMDSNLFSASNLRQKYLNASFKKVEAKSLYTTRNVMVNFKSDNGGEYINCAFKEHLTEARIKHETSTPYYPQQNGKAKRNNKQS
jgi:transposase InsO family protein